MNEINHNNTTTKNDELSEQILQSLRQSNLARTPFPFSKNSSDISPPHWAPTNATAQFLPAQERGKLVSITGRVYSTDEFTQGLIELLQKLPLLSSCFVADHTLFSVVQANKAKQVVQSPNKAFNGDNTKNSNTKTSNGEPEQETEREQQNDKVQGLVSQLFVKAITHKSFGTGKVEYNERMAFMGRHILSLYVSELCSSKYGSDHSLNLNTLKLTESIYTNPCTLAYIIALKYWQVNPLNTLRVYGWNEMTPGTQKDVLADMVLSMITTVFEVRGPKAADQFIEQVLIQETPSQIFKQLLHVRQNELILMDVMRAYTGNPLRVIEEKLGHNNYKCSYFDGIQLVGYATADTKAKARSLAAMNGLVALGTKLPQY